MGVVLGEQWTGAQGKEGLTLMGMEIEGRGTKAVRTCLAAVAVGTLSTQLSTLRLPSSLLTRSRPRCMDGSLGKKKSAGTYRSFEKREGRKM